MKIQFFSDVHLEFGPAPLPHTDADVIIAAGDVNVGASGVAWLKSSGKPTIYVAGNHEFDGRDLLIQIAPTNVNAGVHYLLRGTATPPDWEIFLYHRYLRSFSALWKLAH